MTKILIYYSHKETLGHAVRIMTLAQSFIKFSKPGTKVFLLQAGKKQGIARTGNGIVSIDIPYPYDSKAQFKNIRPDLGSIPYRADFIARKIRLIRPDCAIVEFFPFARSICLHEISQGLLFLKEKGIPVFASVGYPYLDYNLINNPGRFLQLVKIFNRIYIHTPEEFENHFFQQAISDKRLKKTYSDIFRALKDKIVYTGYILPDLDNAANTNLSEIQRWSAFKGKKVLVSRGGGTIWPKVVTASIMAKKYLGVGYSILISAGTATNQKEWSFFKKLLKNSGARDVVLVRYIPDFYTALKNCDISVNLAGYNTSVQVLKLNKRSVTIPYVAFKELGWTNDQPPRALLLKKFAGSRVLPYADLTARSLASALEDLARIEGAGEHSYPENFFAGAKTTVESVLQFIR
ncbi:MAG: glycosyltransferase [Candidatus Omnitrophota bacterium]|nr:glycosyltransferase [Candidatus Omnitrophota bacterium]